MIDNKTKFFAALAVIETFHSDFSSLANAYLRVAAGLDMEYVKKNLDKKASVERRIKSLDTSYMRPPIRIKEETGGTMDHDTLLEALEDPEATAVFFNGREVFRKEDGKWKYVF